MKSSVSCHNTVAVGDSALFSQVNDAYIGYTENTAIGNKAMFSNTGGYENAATGFAALFANEPFAKELGEIDKQHHGIVRGEAFHHRRGRDGARTVPDHAPKCSTAERRNKQDEQPRSCFRVHESSITQPRVRPRAPRSTGRHRALSPSSSGRRRAVSAIGRRRSPPSRGRGELRR